MSGEVRPLVVDALVRVHRSALELLAITSAEERAAVARALESGEPCAESVAPGVLDLTFKDALVLWRRAKLVDEAMRALHPLWRDTPDRSLNNLLKTVPGDVAADVVSLLRDAGLLGEGESW